MKVNDILKNVLETNAALEFTNEIVLAILKSSRDICTELRQEMLRKLKCKT